MWWETKIQVGKMPCRSDLVAVVACHENLSPSSAHRKVTTLLEERWGPPAIRQMIQDEIDHAAVTGRWPNVDGLIDTYQWCCENLPVGDDRRLQPRTH